MKTLVAIAALCLPAGAQTVAIPGMLVTIPARAVPSQTFTIDVPKNGGKMSITIPSQILPPQVSSTAPRTAAVSLGSITINFTCAGPDLQHLSCQATQQVAALPRSPFADLLDHLQSCIGDCHVWRPILHEDDEVQEWGDWPPDQHVSKPGDKPEGRCQEDSTGECFDERRKIVPCWHPDQIAPCAAIVEPNSAAVSVAPKKEKVK